MTYLGFGGSLYECRHIGVDYPVFPILFPKWPHCPPDIVPGRVSSDVGETVNHDGFFSSGSLVLLNSPRSIGMDNHLKFNYEPLSLAPTSRGTVSHVLLSLGLIILNFRSEPVSEFGE